MAERRVAPKCTRPHRKHRGGFRAVTPVQPDRVFVQQPRIRKQPLQFQWRSLTHRHRTARSHHHPVELHGTHSRLLIRHLHQQQSGWTAGPRQTASITHRHTNRIDIRSRHRTRRIGIICVHMGCAESVDTTGQIHRAGPAIAPRDFHHMRTTAVSEAARQTGCPPLSDVLRQHETAEIHSRRQIGHIDIERLCAGCQPVVHNLHCDRPGPRHRIDVRQLEFTRILQHKWLHTTAVAIVHRSCPRARIRVVK